ncbi:MAG: Uma2 family endonuclease, partial [Synechocystis sp.]
MTVFQAPSNTAPTLLKSDTWIAASWDDFLQATENPEYGKAKFYYYQNHVRIEMSPVGNYHADDHSTILGSIHLYLATHQLNVMVKDNCSYRKTGHQEAQPDISCYVSVDAIDPSLGAGIVNLDESPPPDLVIEIANSSLADDQGKKHLLYEELGVKEYWIVDVKTSKILAFKMANQSSRQIRES